MSHYVVKNIMVDLVDNSASVCIYCDAGKRPTQISMSFPISVSARQGEGELRQQAREKAKMVLMRALETLQGEEEEAA